MTIVRIAHAEPRPGKLEHGGFQTLGWLVVLADDAGHRAVPVWLRGEPGGDDLAELIEVAARPDEEREVSAALGLGLTGTGSIALRNPELRIADPARGA
jgi:hypothetical protein